MTTIWNFSYTKKLKESNKIRNERIDREKTTVHQKEINYVKNCYNHAE